MIEFKCRCGKRLSLSDECVGRKVRCTECKQEMIVPNVPIEKKVPACEGGEVTKKKTSTFYVKSGEGNVEGPMVREQLQFLADQGKIKPTWYVSSDRQTWWRAARVNGLFATLDSVLELMTSKLEAPEDFIKGMQTFSRSPQQSPFRFIYDRHSL